MISIYENTRLLLISKEPSISIGRGEGNDLVLNSDIVSREHARISFDGQNYLIRDLNSTNGTFVNNQRVSQQYLEDGSTLQIGNLHLTIRIQKDVYAADSYRQAGPYRQEQVYSPPVSPAPQPTPQQPQPYKPAPSAFPPSQQPVYNPPPAANQYPPNQFQPQPQQYAPGPVQVIVKKPESTGFAWMTLFFWLVFSPLGLLLNIIGLFTGPSRGCFVRMIIMFVVVPGVIIGGLLLLAYDMISPYLDDITNFITGIVGMVT